MDRRKKKWIDENRPPPRSTLYYRRKYQKGRGPPAAFVATHEEMPQSHDHEQGPIGRTRVDQQQQVYELGASSSNALQLGHSSIARPAALEPEDEDATSESHSNSLSLGTFSSSDESSDGEVRQNVKLNPVQSAKPRRKVLARKRLDSDDALSSSSDSCGSEISILSAASSAAPSPEPSPAPKPQGSPRISPDYECDVLEEDNCTRPEKSSAHPRNAQEPLCPCTDITVEEVLFMTLTLGLRHGLTWVAQVDILKMLSTIFKSASIPTTKHTYKERLNVKDEEDITYHVFCNVCDQYIGIKPKKVKTQYCALCEKNIKVSSSMNCFVSLSIESQLKKFLQDDSFVDNVMNYRFKYPAQPQVYSEIYDGQVYKSFMGEEGILSSPHNFSLTFFTDGVAFGKSSNKTIWPIYLTVNELPYQQRGKYFILAGVYAGAKDPNQLYFLKPLVDAMNNLSVKGVKWVHNGNEVTSIVIVICCVADSGARYQLLNYKQFLSAYGCTFCYRISTYIDPVGSRYPVTNDTAEMRSDQCYREDIAAVQASRSLVNRSHRGVKGTCNLYDLNYFSIFNGFVVDYMHNILIGCAKGFTNLILESAHKKKWIGVSENNVGVKTLLTVIDKRIDSIQSSTAVVRELRGLSSHALWRASEWRLWLLFYFAPCLKGLLKEAYIIHFSYLSKATSILLQRSVTHEQVQEAHQLLMHYTFFHERYFGPENMVYNIHLLSHIAQCVLNFGPIWGHSSFMYESKNRYLLQLCKNPNSVSLEISRKFFIFQSLPHLALNLNCSEKIIDFSEGLLNYKKVIKCHWTNNQNCLLLGQPERKDIPPDVKQKLNSASNYCYLYQRMLHNNYRYTTSMYSEKMKNNDSFIFLHSGECCIVHNIIEIPDLNRVLLKVQSVIYSSAPMFRDGSFKFDCISKVVRLGPFRFVPLEEVDKPCLFINISRCAQYIARIPYGSTVE